MDFEKRVLTSGQESVVEPLIVEGRESLANRLAYFITGLRADDPRMIERITEDQRIIRAKYGLPDWGLLASQPTDYERILKEIIEREGVNLRSKSECGSFFEENQSAGGAFSSGSKIIGADMDRGNKENYLRSLGVLEHETIHALQHRYYPGMPIELMEYEAYIAGGDMKFLTQNPEAVATVFDTLIGGSVNFWYDRMSKMRGETISPEWDK